jgi:hypothetical protein
LGVDYFCSYNIVVVVFEMNNCQHKEWYSDYEDVFPLAICIDCGASKILDLFNNIKTTHSQSRQYKGYWSNDFQFIYEDCTWMTLEEYNKRFDD